MPCQQCRQLRHADVKDPEETVEVDHAVEYCYPGTSDKEMHKFQLKESSDCPGLHHFQDGRQPDGNMCRSQSPLPRWLLEQWQCLELRNGVLGRWIDNHDDS